jgi:hypothetical protein
MAYEQVAGSDTTESSERKADYTKIIWKLVCFHNIFPFEIEIEFIIVPDQIHKVNLQRVTVCMYVYINLNNMLR